MVQRVEGDARNEDVLLTTEVCDERACYITKCHERARDCKNMGAS